MQRLNKLFLLSIFLSSNVFAADIKQSLAAYMQAWNEHDEEKIESFFADDVIWYDLAFDSNVKGKQKVSKAITAAFMGNVPDMYWFRSGDIFISKNTIIYEWTYGGTFNGKLGEVAINNKAFMVKGISTTTFNDQGKITAQKDYYDMASMVKALEVGQ